MTTRREVGPTLHLSGVPKGARPLQGRTAGFATRAMAGVVDVISVLAFIAVGLLLVNGFVLAVDPVRFEPVLVPFAVTLVGALVISVAYLTIAWASMGRTFGSAVLGIRVVTAGTHARLPLPRALVRAAFATVFPIGLAWVIVSPKRRSLHDRLVGSAVLSQW